MICRQAIQTARFLGVPPVCVGVHEARGILAKKEEEVVVSSTVFQNNAGAYLELCTKENIIITKNGKKRAVLLHYPRNHDGLEAGEPAADYGTSPPPRLEGWVVDPKEATRQHTLDHGNYIFYLCGYEYNPIGG